MATGRRALAVWTAAHDNGWTTNALENLDGTFSAWAAPDPATVAIDYIEDGPEHAKIAAEYALRQKTGHTRCSAGCSGWQLHFHEVELDQG